MLRKADIITAISKHLAKYAKKTNPKAKISVIPNGINIKQFQENKQKIRKFSIPIIITVSRLVEKNGLNNLIEATNIVQKHIPRIQLLIVGDGELANALIEKTRQLKLTHNICFIGEVTNNKIPPLLKLSNIFVRTLKNEGLGNAFLEAMAAKIPVIGTPVGGIKDIIIHNKTGIFVTPEDPEALAKAIIRLIKYKNLRKKLVRNATKFIKNYEWKIIAKQYSKIYSQNYKN
jgi:glycosyltransferase involved in cell wall biosynthesis